MWWDLEKEWCDKFGERLVVCYLGENSVERFGEGVRWRCIGVAVYHHTCTLCIFRF